MLALASTYAALHRHGQHLPLSRDSSRLGNARLSSSYEKRIIFFDVYHHITRDGATTGGVVTTRIRVDTLYLHNCISLFWCIPHLFSPFFNFFLLILEFSDTHLTWTWGGCSMCLQGMAVYYIMTNVSYLKTPLSFVKNAVLYCCPCFHCCFGHGRL